MANRLKRLRTLAYAASALMLGAAGCAFPHGATGGDPVLGNFSRPIVATPPPERGGLGPDSPAYDAGARIGVAPPEIQVPAENSSGLMTRPSLTYPSLSASAQPNSVQLVRHEVLCDPAKVNSMEEAQALLRLLGAKAQRTEQRTDGDWVCTCVIGHVTCVGRGIEPIDAMRQLLEQVDMTR